MADISSRDELLRITRLTAAYMHGSLRPDVDNAWTAEKRPPGASPDMPRETRRAYTEDAPRALGDADAPGETPPRDVPVSAGEGLPDTREARAEALTALRDSFKDCQRCAIAKNRHTLVFGQGNSRARLMIIGEGPGEQEDLQGIAFCGPSGELLTKMLSAIKLQRDEVYIANIIKCRPPGNRNPLPEEVANCREYLDRQIDIIRPALICSMGNVATKTLLETETGIMRLRGTIQDYRGITVVPTYHPSFLLRDASRKKEAWIDMQLIQRLLAETPGGA